MVKLFKKITAAILTATVLLSFAVPVSHAAAVTGWEFVNSGGQQLTYSIDTSEKHSGNASLKMSYKTTGGDNVYAALRKYIPVEPNTNYTYSMWIKAKGITNVQNLISWGTRYQIASFGSDFNWKKFEFTWNSGSKTTAEFMVILASSLNAIWFDDMTFCKEGSDVNLFANPGFEEGVAIEGTPPKDEASDKTEGDDVIIDVPVQETEIKTIQESGAGYLNYRYFPIVKKSNVSIDGNLDEWDSAATITKEENGIQVTLKSQYDEDYLYIAAQTPDTVHSATTQGTGPSAYDSIRISLGMTGENAGVLADASFGENGELYFYSEQWHQQYIDHIKSYGKHENNISTYEVAIPWSMWDGDYSRNDMRMSFALHDNDNNSEGLKKLIIGSYKTTRGYMDEDFMHLDFIDNGEISGNMFASSEIHNSEEATFAIFAVNNSDVQKDVKVTTFKDSKNVKIPANSVYMEEFPYVFKDFGTASVEGSLEAKNASVKLANDFTVKRSTKQIMSEYELFKNEMIPEIDALIKKCDGKNIPTDYELADYTLIKFMIERVPQDVEHEYFDRAEYILDCLYDIYDNTKANLNAYLSGEKEALVTYKYQTSPLEFEGETIWADTKNSKTGEIEKRPVYLIGWTAFSQNDIVDYMSDLGFSLLAFDSGVSWMIKNPVGMDGWSVISSKPNSTSQVVYENGESGNSVLRITSTEDVKANQFRQIYQMRTLKPNTVYEYGFRIKGKDVSHITSLPGGWSSPRNTVAAGTYDWTNYDYEFTTGANQKSTEFMLLVDGIVEEAFIDDIYLREKGTQTNLLVNGNFENLRNLEIYKGMVFDPAGLTVKPGIQTANETNVSICLQLSPHYWAGWATANDPMAQHGDAHFTGGANYSYDRVREVMEYCIKGVLEEIKDEPAVSSICLNNEPGYCTMGNEAFYNPLYREYLARIYDNDISKLNANYDTEYQSFEEITLTDVKQGDPNEKWITFGIDLSKVEPTPMFYDWVNFNNDIYTDWVGFMYNTVKKYAPDLPVHIKMLANTWSYDHDYFRQFLRNGVDAEKIAEVTDLSGNDSQGLIGNRENNLSTKMRFYDYQGSMQSAPIIDSEDHTIPDGSLNYDPIVASWAGAAVWQGAVHGRTMDGIWVWSTQYNNDVLDHSYQVRPDCVHKQSKSALDLNRLAYEVKSLTDAQADVAVLESLSSHCLSNVYENIAYNSWQASTYNGQRTRFVTEKQCVEGKLNDYKVVIVPKCDRVQQSTIEALRKFIANGGRVIMLGDDCLKYNEYGHAFDESVYADVRANSRIIPITWSGLSIVTPTSKEIRDIFTQEFDALGMNKVMLIDTATGEPVYNVEWEYANYDDSIIINVNNYEWEFNPTVAIEVNGQRVSEFTELRSMETKNGTIELEPYEPVLLKVPGNV